jgi:hypothetical protein
MHTSTPPPRHAAHEQAATTPPTRGWRRATLEVIACSLLVTACAGVVAVAVALVAPDVRWSYAFVVARWLFVAALLVTPLLHQVGRRFGVPVFTRMPWAFQTPATALLLTAESIGLDILSARLGD